MAVILVALQSTAIKSNAGTRYFYYCVLSNALGLIIDALSYLLEGKTVNDILLTIVTALAYILSNLCIVFFSLYLISIIREKRQNSFRHTWIIMAVSLIDILIILTGTITGNLFTIENNVCVYGPWSSYTGVLPSLGLVFLLYVLFKNSKDLGKRYTVTLTSFMVSPLLTVVLAILYPNVDFSFVASAISCEIIFIFIQNDIIAEYRMHEKVLNKYSYTDTLTGLGNRRTFEDAIVRSKDHSMLGVIFCDLNELKYTNDHFGHEAGDNYIKRFADILRNVIRNTGEICRISGDEFVTIIYDIEPDEFNEISASLADEINNNNRMAAMGKAHGLNMKALELIHQAEQDMYLDKSKYYMETGKNRRN